MLSSETAALTAPIFRIISMAIQHPGNNDELRDEELVAAIVTLRQSQKNNLALKVQLFSTLLLDLKIWSLCSYGLQKKLLSSLADMVFTESSIMQDANAIQMYLDGCRRLVVQPNTARAQTFVEACISSGGIESLLVLLQKEAKAGDHSVPESMTRSDGSLSVQDTELESDARILERSKDDKVGSQEGDMQGKDFESQPLNTGSGPVAISAMMNIERMSYVSEYPFIKNLGGISHFIQCKK
ncbi:hypothetical protein Q3G72_013287 [Acer saccharum]|nr:hypothetical protein Q3G72_013287 [Acer saccharum]